VPSNSWSKPSRASPKKRPPSLSAKHPTRTKILDDRSKNWFANDQKLYKKASKLFINNFYQFIYKILKILTIVQIFGSAENVKFVKRGFSRGGVVGFA
jgi:hypothetical protein